MILDSLVYSYNDSLEALLRGVKGGLFVQDSLGLYTGKFKDIVLVTLLAKV